MDREKLYLDALQEIAALPLGGNRTARQDIENYEKAVTTARATLFNANAPHP